MSEKLPPSQVARSFGPLTREQLHELAAAPYGRARQLVDDLQLERAKADLTTLVAMRLRRARAEPIGDPDWLAAEACDLVDDVIILLNDKRLLR